MGCCMARLVLFLLLLAVLLLIPGPLSSALALDLSPATFEEAHQDLRALLDLSSEIVSDL